MRAIVAGEGGTYVADYGLDGLAREPQSLEKYDLTNGLGLAQLVTTTTFSVVK